MNWYKKAQRAVEKGIVEKDVDPKELEKGIEVELEHTDDKEEAKKIALDHLAEFDDYYTRLIKMETDAEKEASQKRWYKKAALTLTEKEKVLLRKLIKKIMRGERNWTPEELQFQTNYPDMVENTLIQKHKELST